MKKICLKKNGKEPIESGYYKRDYSTKLLKWDGNVGLCLDDETVILDVDVRNGGLESLQKLKAKLGEGVFITYCVETPTNGLHFYFSKSSKVCLHKNKDFPGVDIKTGERQYVLVPPSEINGRCYKVINDRKISELPDKILNIFSSELRTKLSSEEGPWTTEKLDFYLDQLNTEEYKDQDDWFQILCASHEATNGDKHALQSFLRWCAKDEVYSSDEIAQEIMSRWNSLSNKQTMISRKTLIAKVNTKDFLPDFDGLLELPLDIALDKVSKVHSSVLSDQLLKDLKHAHSVSTTALKSQLEVIKSASVKKKKTLYELATKLKDMYKLVLMYTIADEMFWVFNGKTWQAMHDRLILRYILRIVARRTVQDAYKITSEAAAAKELLDYAKIMLATNFNFYMHQQLRHEIIVPTRSKLVKATDVFELETYEYDKSDFVSTRFDFDYVPHERSTKVFDDFLDGIFPNDTATQILIYEIFGYAFLSRKPIPAIFVFQGQGKNGKTTLAKVLSSWIGFEKTASIDLEHLDADKHSYSNIVSKYLAIDDDVNKSARIPDGTLKKLSESKPLEANPKGKPAFMFVNTAMLLLLTNHILHSWDVSEGLRRRLVLIPFATKIENPDLRIYEKLINNRELKNHVISKAIDYAMRVLKAGAFSLSLTVKSTTSTWIENLDSTSIFIKDFLKPSKRKEKFTLIYETYKDYCNSEGIKEYSAMRFREQLLSSGFVLEKVGGGKYVVLNCELQ